MKVGFVSLVGRTNVGKSSILNEIIGEKISIVTYKPQTTRTNVRGIYNDEEAQIIFLDTPGIHHPHKQLGQKMNKSAYNAMKDVDVIIYVIDTSLTIDELDEEIISSLKSFKNLILCFNKIDLVKIDKANEVKEYYSSRLPQAKQVETSVPHHFNFETLISLIKDKLEEGPLYYNPIDKTDSSLSFKIAETIREKSLKFLKQEVPHAIFVEVEKIEFKSEKMIILANIIVETEGQKKIVIGKNGAMIKRIGVTAREDLENLFKKSIRLELFVKVKEDWRDSNSFLKNF